MGLPAETPSGSSLLPTSSGIPAIASVPRSGHIHPLLGLRGFLSGKRIGMCRVAAGWTRRIGSASSGPMAQSGEAD
jgi:hypothetical protein